MENVLGFKEKDAAGYSGMNVFMISESKLVPVVEVESLKKFRLKKLKEMLDRDEERVYANGYLCALDDVIQEAIRLQAVKK